MALYCVEALELLGRFQYHCGFASVCKRFHTVSFPEFVPAWAFSVACLLGCSTTMHYTPRICAPSTPSGKGLRLSATGVKGWLGAVLLAASTAASAFTHAPAIESPSAQVQASSVVALTALPVQGQDVYRRILAGGPFRYGKDGTVFGNRERLLPGKPRGFYREYTVPTPGSRDRGARRIVCGGEIVKRPETCFYTKDHYQSFQKIDPKR
jgi:ribonuclease T1